MKNFQYCRPFNTIQKSQYHKEISVLDRILSIVQKSQHCKEVSVLYRSLSKDNVLSTVQKSQYGQSSQYCTEFSVLYRSPKNVLKTKKILKKVKGGPID